MTPRLTAAIASSGWTEKPGQVRHEATAISRRGARCCLRGRWSKSQPPLPGRYLAINENGLHFCKPLIIWRARQDKSGHWREVVSVR